MWLLLKLPSDKVSSKHTPHPSLAHHLFRLRTRGKTRGKEGGKSTSGQSWNGPPRWRKQPPCGMESRWQTLPMGRMEKRMMMMMMMMMMMEVMDTTRMMRMIMAGWALVMGGEGGGTGWGSMMGFSRPSPCGERARRVGRRRPSAVPRSGLPWPSRKRRARRWRVG